MDESLESVLAERRDQMERLLIVEDAESLRGVLATVLQKEGYQVDSYADAESALQAIKTNTYSCILADFKLPQKNGIELLKEAREISKAVPYIIMTAYGSIDIAVEAMKHGANDFLCKPFEPELLCRNIRDVIEHKRIVDRSIGTSRRRERSYITQDPAVLRILHQAGRVAKVDSSVLVLGESGTGKELIARYIHEQSPRANEAFVAVNCAALPPDLLESEFFGHESGAFTGATQSRVGVFELASNGTIFLDEIGDTPLALQVKLLRALQEKEIKRVGGNKTIKVNPRIIAATNHDVEDAISSGKIREDFYYRIAVVSFTLPPLRERKGDIKLLADYYLKYFAGTLNKHSLSIHPDTEYVLVTYSWPGNARELENVLERAAILAEDVIKPEHLGLNLNLDMDALSESTITLPEIATHAARKAEVDLITRVLHQTLGNKTKAAQILGVSYKTLLNKVKEYNIERAETL